MDTQQPKTVATVPVSVFIAGIVLTAFFTAAGFTWVQWLRKRSRQNKQTQRKWPLVIGSPHVLNRSFGSTRTLRADEEGTGGKSVDGSDWEEKERDIMI